MDVSVAPKNQWRVLAVCTANLCRSPMMQFLLADVLPDGWTIRSAGTRAINGREMEPLTRDVLADRGIAGTRFGSRRLTGPMIDAADLVLTAEVGHRGAVVEVRPNAVNRTFTLLQFARLLEVVEASDDNSDLPTLIVAARKARARARRGDDDLPDPIGQPRASYESIADRIARAAETIAVVSGAPSSSSRRTIPSARPFAPTL